MADQHVRRVARAVGRHASAHANHTAQRHKRYAVVLDTTPIQVEVMNADLVLDEDDLVLSQHVRWYDAGTGIDVGDVVTITLMHNGDWLVSDVVTEKDPDITSGAGAPTGPAGGVLSGVYPNPGFAGSPTFTGTVTAPTLAVTTLSGTPNFSGAATGQTATTSDSSGKLATTAFVHAVADSLSISGAAGGDLTGTYPNPTIAAGAITNAKVSATAAIAESKLALATDAPVGTPSRRTLGTGATQAAAGDDPRFTDARAPTGAAGGVLSGTYPNPGLANSAVANVNVSSSAAIAYSKLNLAGSLVNADVASGAAIAESKLNLASDAAATVASRRTLGTGALQAASGADVRFNHVVRVEEYARATGETDDTGRWNRAATDAVALGRPLWWTTPLVVNGITPPSGLLALGPAKLTINSSGTVYRPISIAAGSHDITFRGFEIDGNKAAISGDPDVDGNPTCLVIAAGTAASPCKNIRMENMWAHDSKRLGIVYQYVQGGCITGRIAHNERDGATVYFTSTDIHVDLDVWDCGDDHLGINSGEGAVAGLCERITGSIRAYGPSARGKGRAVTVRGGSDIDLNVQAKNMSQTAVFIQDWVGVPVTNLSLDVLIDGVSGTSDQHGVNIDLANTGSYIRHVQVKGLIRGAGDRGLRITVSKASPSDDDVRDIYVPALEVYDSGGHGVEIAPGASAQGVNDVWLSNLIVRSSAGDGLNAAAVKRLFVQTSRLYDNTGWGAKLRSIAGGALRGTRITGNGGGGLNRYAWSGTFDYSDNAVTSNTGTNIQDDGSHTATYVAASTAGDVTGAQVFSQQGGANQIALANDGNLYFSNASGRPYIAGSAIASTHLSDSASLARLASPVFTGQVSAPLAAVGAPSYTFTGDLDTGMWSPGANTLALSVGGAEQVRVASGGRVTLGGGAASGWGYVTGVVESVQSSQSSSVAFGNGGDAYVLSNAIFDGANWKYKATGPVAEYVAYNGTHTFNAAASAAAGSTVTWAERLKLGVTGVGFFGHAEQARPTAYTLNSSTTSRNLPVSSSATAAQIADVLRQVITDLQGYGLLQ